MRNLARYFSSNNNMNSLFVFNIVLLFITNIYAQNIPIENKVVWKKISDKDQKIEHVDINKNQKKYITVERFLVVNNSFLYKIEAFSDDDTTGGKFHYNSEINTYYIDDYQYRLENLSDTVLIVLNENDKVVSKYKRIKNGWYDFHKHVIEIDKYAIIKPIKEKNSEKSIYDYIIGVLMVVIGVGLMFYDILSFIRKSNGRLEESFSLKHRGAIGVSLFLIIIGIKVFLL